MLYALFKFSIPFPLLGLILNSIYYGLIVMGIVYGGLTINRTMAGLGNPATKTRTFVIWLCLIAFPAGFISSRAANMFYFPMEQWSRTLFVEQFLHGDRQTFHAGLILPFLLISMLMMKMKIDFGQGWDVVFLHVPLAHAFGRMGCFLVGCCWGRKILISCWGTTWSFEPPVPLLAVFLNLLLYFILKKQFQRSYGSSLADSRGKGGIAALYLVCYGIIRIGLEQLRKEKIIALGMTQAQIAMIGFIGVGCLLLALIYWKQHAVES